MATTSESLAFDRGVRPMLEIVLPGKANAVIGFQADPDLQARIEELARKSTEGELTEDERAEYVGYVRANKFVAILKRQAQQIANYFASDPKDKPLVVTLGFLNGYFTKLAMVHQLAGMDISSVRHRPVWRGTGQCKPRLPHA